MNDSINSKEDTNRIALVTVLMALQFGMLEYYDAFKSNQFHLSDLILSVFSKSSKGIILIFLIYLSLLGIGYSYNRLKIWNVVDFFYDFGMAINVLTIFTTIFFVLFLKVAEFFNNLWIFYIGVILTMMGGSFILFYLLEEPIKILFHLLKGLTNRLIIWLKKRKKFLAENIITKNINSFKENRLMSKKDNSEKNFSFEKYRLLFEEIRHQDQQLWQVSIFFFGLNAGLFAVFTFLTNFVVKDEFFFGGSKNSTLIFIMFVCMTGILICMHWKKCASRITTYIRAQQVQRDEIERETKFFDIQRKIKEYLEKAGENSSVKSFYTDLIPLVTCGGWIVLLALVIGNF